MELVAFLGSDTENWGQVTALMKRMSDAHTYLVKSKHAPAFPKPEKGTLIEVDSTKPLRELKALLQEKLKAKLSGDFEVAVSLASGNGKEHMALLSALLNIPVGIRLVIFTKDGIEYIT